MRELEIKKVFGKTMVVVPHQDDEILIAGGLLYQLQQLGQEPYVVMVTNGDYGCSDTSKGEARLKETLKGTQLLQIPSDHIIFLGYADTGMAPEESFLTNLYNSEDENLVYPSHCGCETYGIEGKYEYHKEKYGIAAKYTRANLKEDLKEIIEEYLPESILTTSEFDLHGDHEALYKFLVEILDDMKINLDYKPNLYCGVVHSCAGDERWPIPNTPYFTCPEGLEERTNLKWEDRIVLPMTSNMRLELGEKNLKYQALLQYEIALEPNAYEYLMSFIKEEEVFWKVR